MASTSKSNSPQINIFSTENWKSPQRLLELASPIFSNLIVAFACTQTNRIHELTEEENERTNFLVALAIHNAILDDAQEQFEENLERIIEIGDEAVKVLDEMRITRAELVVAIKQYATAEDIIALDQAVTRAEEYTEQAEEAHASLKSEQETFNIAQEEFNEMPWLYRVFSRRPSQDAVLAAQETFTNAISQVITTNEDIIEIADKYTHQFTPDEHVLYNRFVEQQNTLSRLHADLERGVVNSRAIIEATAELQSTLSELGQQISWSGEVQEAIINAQNSMIYLDPDTLTAAILETYAGTELPARIERLVEINSQLQDEQDPEHRQELAQERNEIIKELTADHDYGLHEYAAAFNGAASPPQTAPSPEPNRSPANEIMVL